VVTKDGIKFFADGEILSYDGPGVWPGSGSGKQLSPLAVTARIVDIDGELEVTNRERTVYEQSVAVLTASLSMIASRLIPLEAEIVLLRHAMEIDEGLEVVDEEALRGDRVILAGLEAEREARLAVVVGDARRVLRLGSDNEAESALVSWSEWRAELRLCEQKCVNLDRSLGSLRNKRESLNRRSVSAGRRVDEEARRGLELAAREEEEHSAIAAHEQAHAAAASVADQCVIRLKELRINQSKVTLPSFF
jgi:hypothetical protein